MQLNVNTQELKEFSGKLKQISRSALPVSIRGSLNKAAFDVKSTTMPESANKAFIQRKPTFFKANSKVEAAKGFDVEIMKATVGFTPKSGADNSVSDLLQQEEGGTIGGRSFIPLKEARTGKSWNKVVRSKARISDIKSQIIDSNKAAGKSEAEKFIRSAIHAGKGGWIIGTNKNSKGNKTLLQIRSIVRKNGNTIINSVPMFSVKKARKVSPKATHFMQHSSLKSGGKMNEFFITEAKKQIDKIK